MRLVGVLCLWAIGCGGTNPGGGGTTQGCAKITLTGTTSPPLTADWTQGLSSCLHYPPNAAGNPQFIVPTGASVGQGLGVAGLNINYGKTVPVGPVGCRTGDPHLDDNASFNNLMPPGGVWYSESGSVTVSANKPYEVTYNNIVMLPVPKCEPTSADNPGTGSFVINGTATFN